MADYNELASFEGLVGKSPQERYLQNGDFQAVLQFICDWDAQDSVMAELAQNGGQVYPRKPATGARAIGASIVGYGQASQNATNSKLIDYEKALITCYYSTQAPRLISNKFVTERIEPRYEHFAVTTSGLCWGSASGDALDSQDPIYHFVPGLTYVLQFHHVYSPPAGAVTLLGYCNAASMGTYFLGLTFGAETARYTTPFIRRTVQLGTANDMVLGYRFDIKPSGWNTYWNREKDDVGGWDTVYVSGGSRYRGTPLGNFALLVP